MLNINENLLMLSNGLPLFLFDIQMAAYFGVTPHLEPEEGNKAVIYIWTFVADILWVISRCNVFIMFIISKHVVNVILGPRGDGEEKYLETNIIIREIAKQGTWF